MLLAEIYNFMTMDSQSGARQAGSAGLAGRQADNPGQRGQE